MAPLTHDYKRHGTTTLFAALDVKSGMVIGDCMPQYRLESGKRHSHLRQRQADLYHRFRLIPLYDGLLICAHQKDALWDNFFTGAPGSGHVAPPVRATMTRARRPGCHTAIESFERGIEPRVEDKRQSHCEVA